MFRSFSIQNASGILLRSLYVRQPRYAVPYGHDSLFGHTVCSDAHTGWRNLPGAGFQYTSHSYYCTGLQQPFRFPKHRREYRKERRCPHRHGISFSFSPDASSHRNGKRRLTAHVACQEEIKPDNQPVPLWASGSPGQKPFTLWLNESGG